MPLNNDLRRLWRDRGFTGKEGSAAVCMPPPPNSSRVYYLTSAEYAISNIVFSRLKVARFSELNDPFELLSPRTAQTHSNAEIRQFRANYNVDNGVLCFSSDWIDPVLWSHYGARHTGICLGFIVPDAILRNVQYRTDRVVIDTSVNRSGINAALADTILRTKFESWRYEKERRMLVPLSTATEEGRLYFASFDEELNLSEVILGPLCNMSVANVRDIVSKFYNDVTVIQSRLAWNSFQVVPMESTVPRLRAPVDPNKPAKKKRSKR
ncbi:DUF2971 domain-containing protein [Bradyrhizobium pachyrhizi]|uniref:DUF2971 domain-containing protein n=1 Tax=Bradyrhizobium pachyrhizi TaxID=280333 RepID=UPI0024B24144|nr:DUF2971 domain-containing protein [Bradyrhizobium pachyrhizi]WFU56714.1 DUF2971 domain-containing protein [Bradyrhizobium pachyrhizi]